VGATLGVCDRSQVRSAFDDGDGEWFARRWVRAFGGGVIWDHEAIEGVKVVDTLIPESLLASGYRAENGEMAWDKENALSVLRWAEDCGVCVLGLEVWIPTVPGPTIPMPFVYAFDPRRDEGESDAVFLARANTEVVNYVNSFEWDVQDTAHHAYRPFFNLTFGVRRTG
jgi:hypothetical protein